MKCRAVFVCFATLVLLVAAAPAWAQHTQYYILDGYGGIHSGDGAPAITGAPYFGWDIARDIAYIPVGTPSSIGDGMLVLDGFGGAHAAGALIADPSSTTPPYFGFDIARAIVRRDAPVRVATSSSATVLDISTTSASWTTLRGLTIYAPVDGYLHIVGTSYMGCQAGGASNNLVARLGASVDSTSATSPFAMGNATWANCNTVAGFFPTHNRTISMVVAVTAGPHAVRLLGIKAAGTGTVRFLGRSLNVQFVAADHRGDLAPALLPTAPVVDESSDRVIR